jgi:hypothetical protein
VIHRAAGVRTPRVGPDDPVAADGDSYVTITAKNRLQLSDDRAL